MDWGGNYTLKGREVLSAGLDLAGIVDPTGAADTTNTALQVSNEEWVGAVISGLSIIPYIGDIAKIFNIKKDYNIIKTAIQNFRNSHKAQKSFSDILESAELGRITKGNTKIFRKQGGFKSAEKDFKDLKLSEVKTFSTKYGKAKRGVNSNVETIILRRGSSDGHRLLKSKLMVTKKLK